MSLHRLGQPSKDLQRFRQDKNAALKRGSRNTVPTHYQEAICNWYILANRKLTFLPWSVNHAIEEPMPRKNCSLPRDPIFLLWSFIYCILSYCFFCLLFWFSFLFCFWDRKKERDRAWHWMEKNVINIYCTEFHKKN